MQPLAQSNRRRRQPADLLDGIHVLRQQWLLKEHGLVRLQKARELFRHRLVHAAVEVNTSIEAERLHGLDTLNAAREGGWRVHPTKVFGGVHFDGCKALGLSGFAVRS